MNDLQDRMLAEMDRCEPYSARNLAEQLNEPRRTVHHHLQQLVEQEEVNRKENSPRHVSYWID